jgi:sodium transport system permease protein
VASPLRIEEVEVSSAQQRAAKLLGFISMFVIMAAFVGGLQIASDSTAGERERGSLESLLLNPVPREALVAGKWLAAATFGAAAVMFSSLLSIAAMRRIPIHELGARFRFGPEQFFSLVAIAMPLALFGAALVIFIALFARSYKEAQSYLGIVVMIPSLPGMLAMLYPMDGKPWLAPIPIAGQYALASDVIAGKAPQVGWIALAAVAVALASFGLVMLTTRMLKREAIIFGR